MPQSKPSTDSAPWKRRLHEIIFEADTQAGKSFDVALILCIVFSIVVVMVDSVEGFHDSHENLLNSLMGTLKLSSFPGARLCPGQGG